MDTVQEIVDLSDNDDDCVLESVSYDTKSKKNRAFPYDQIFNENPLLAEFIEKCLNLEHSEGMSMVINKTLVGIYKKADPAFKESPEFDKLLKRTMIRLDREPYRRFSHIKDLCEILRSSQFKKRAHLITLEKFVRDGNNSKLSLKRKNSGKINSSKKQKTDIIDVDAVEELGIINVDNYVDKDAVVIDDSPIIIDDEKENSKSTTVESPEKLLVSPQQDFNKIQNILPETSNFGNLIAVIEENVTNNNLNLPYMNNEILEANNELCTPTNTKVDDSPMVIYDEKAHTSKESGNCLVEGSPEKLLVPQKVLKLDETVDSNALVAAEALRLQKIKSIEVQIGIWKDMIAKLDEEEVTEDSVNSPYVRSEMLKKEIVSLYKELCTLTGTESTKRREIRLTVIEGHPPGPVLRLEKFLNEHIGEDGNPPFPDFVDVVECVTKANIKDNLGWNRSQILREATALFTHCGRALQKRRQKREWSDLLSRVKAEECDGDPADEDPALLARLEANKRAAFKKEADILERYSMMEKLPHFISSQINANGRHPYAVGESPLDKIDIDSSDDQNDSMNFMYSNKIKSRVKKTNTNQLDRKEPIEVDSDSQQNIECDTHNVCVNFQNDNICAYSIRDVSPETFQTNTEPMNSTDMGVKIKEIQSETLSTETKTNTIDSNQTVDNNSNSQQNIEDGAYKSHKELPRFSNDICTDFIKTDKPLISPNTSSCDFNHEIANSKEMSNVEEVNKKTTETEFDEVKIKKEPTEEMSRRLDSFGNDYSVSIYDIYDPFLVIEISDSSDED